MPKINNLSKQKKSFFKKRFDLTNKKVRFFVVISIFVILGGGYFTYRSFAAIRNGGILSTQFDFDPKTMPYGAEELEVSIKPLMQNHPDGIFFANQFFFKASSTGKNNQNEAGYVGLQTNNKEVGGKAVIFSIWKALGGTPGIAKSTSKYFTHEGSGWQIIAPYDWSANESYVIKVRFVGTNGAGEDQWRASVRNVKSARVTEIGTIRVNGSWWGIDSSTVVFSEIYASTPNRTCNNMPYIGAEFKSFTLKAGNNVVTPYNQTLRYSAHGREICNFRTRLTPIQFGVKHEMSKDIYTNDFTDRNQPIIK